MPNPNLCPLKVADPKVYSLPGAGKFTTNYLAIILIL